MSKNNNWERTHYAQINNYPRSGHTTYGFPVPADAYGRASCVDRDQDICT